MKVFGKIKYVILFIVATALFYVLSHACIADVIFPFSFSLLFALVWANQKIYVVVPAFLAGSIAADYSLVGIVGALCCAFCAAVPYLIHYFCKKNMKIWELAIYAFVSQVGYIVFGAVGGGNAVYFALISAALGTIFMLGYTKLFESLFMRGVAFRLSAIELISGGVILLSLASGLLPLEVGDFSFLKMFVAFMLLTITYCSKNYYSVFVAALFGLGTLLHSFNPVFVAPFILWALAISPFKTHRKYFSAVVLVLCELLIGFYFKLYYSFSWISILPSAISVVVFMAIPDKIYFSFKALFDLKSDRALVKNVVNQNREILRRRLLSLSDVFGEMCRVFRGLIQQNLSQQDVKALLRDEIICKNCDTCPDKARCHRNRQQEISRVLDELVDIAFTKGKITLLDIPSYLSANCGRINGIISSCNLLARQYKSYSGMLANIDNSKLLIADQLQGISSVMKNLSIEVDSDIAFDSKREERVIEELLFNDIVCTDAVVYEKDMHTFEVGLIVRNSDSDNLKIPDIVSKVCKCKMGIFDRFSGSQPGFTTLSLRSAPKFDCVFALSSATKTGSPASGDSHSVMRLNGDKFMFAVCDGMGSGNQAKSTCETSMSLIENFYKAGFSSELVLSSVNKLLAMQKTDVFSALDVCVLDLKNGLGDFIKMGSPSGFIISSQECKIVSAGALPLGIVDVAQPVTQKLVISDGDTILLFTDGVADSFSDDQKISDFLKDNYSTNPQVIADRLLDQALANNNGRALDDMTILAVKVFNNN